MAKQLKADAPFTNAPGRGRKRLSTEHEDRRLLQICKAHRTKCSGQLSSEFTLSNGTQLSALTIRRKLLDAGYRSYTVKRKHIRNASQRKLRVQFANGYITWPLTTGNEQYVLTKLISSCSIEKIVLWFDHPIPK